MGDRIGWITGGFERTKNGICLVQTGVSEEQFDGEHYVEDG